MSPTPLNENELQRVIARARELDTRNDAQLTQLRDIAAQLNISPAAMDQALAEIAREKEVAVIAASIKTPTSMRSRFRGWLAAATVGVGALSGMAAGLDYRPPGGDSLTEFTVFLLIALSITLTWPYRRDARPWALFGRIAVLWASYAYGWAVGHGEFQGWAFEMALIGGGVSATISGLVHQARRLLVKWRETASARARSHTAARQPDRSNLGPPSGYHSEGARTFSTPLPPHFSTPI